MNKVVQVVIGGQLLLALLALALPPFLRLGGLGRGAESVVGAGESVLHVSRGAYAVLLNADLLLAVVVVNVKSLRP